jgi:multiple antibiotic resistance protein
MDTTLLGFAGTALAGYFAIMNPIANTPVFVSLTTEDDDATKKSVARRSILLTFAIVAAMSITGNYIFSVFGLTMPALRITGGILLFIIGYHMMQGSGSKTHTPSDEDIRTSRESQLSVAVSPLAVPLLAGPGTIATAMSFASYGGLDYVLISLSMFGVICAATYLCFISSEEIIDFLGQGGLNVITRLMGLILATIGTGMFLDGVGAEIAIFVKQFA